MRKRISNIYSLGFLLFELCVCCSCGNNVTITRSYIYSTNWSNGGYQGFQIAKIKLLDSNVSVFDKNFNRFKLSDHIIDSSFCYEESSIRGTNRPKIYFDKEDEDWAWTSCWSALEEKKKIGLLELNSWYAILELKGTIDFYVYIDNEGGSHTYSLGPTNW